MPATSGTVLAYRYDSRKVIEHAARRAGRVQTQLVGEDLVICQDLIFTILAEWINAGFPVWTRQYQLLGTTIAGPDVSTFAGTVDVFHAYWRQFNPWRGSGLTSTGADASVLFAGQPNADVVIPGPNPGVIVNFQSPALVESVGILLGGTSPVTAALQIFVSPDGNTFTLSQTLPSTTMTPGQWSFFDLDPGVVTQVIKIVLPGQAQGIPILTESGLELLTESGQPILTETGGSGVNAWVLNQVLIGGANSTNVELGKLNMEDYWNLPNLYFQADRAVSCFVDRPLNQPIIKIWPTVNINGFYNGCVTALTRRFIQDPGQMTNGIEVPSRFLEALQWRLATLMIYELSDEEKNGQPSYFTLMAKQQRIQNIEQKAQKAESLAWSEERTGGPIRIAPSIRGYTA